MTSAHNHCLHTPLPQEARMFLSPHRVPRGCHPGNPRVREPHALVFRFSCELPVSCLPGPARHGPRFLNKGGFAFHTGRECGRAEPWGAAGGARLCRPRARLGVRRGARYRVYALFPPTTRRLCTEKDSSWFAVLSVAAPAWTRSGHWTQTTCFKAVSHGPSGLPCVQPCSCGCTALRTGVLHHSESRYRKPSGVGTPAIPALRRLRRENRQEFKARLGYILSQAQLNYIIRLRLKQNKKKLPSKAPSRQKQVQESSHYLCLSTSPHKLFLTMRATVSTSYPGSISLEDVLRL